MTRLLPFIIASILLLIVTIAEASIDWKEPEVVPEKLTRSNRRVMRFSGRTTPEALVRIRKNRIKLYLDSGQVRLAQIPQKNRVQFPVKADDSGNFSFDLYIPTIAVELPVEVKERGKKWQPHTLNFRVPDAGAASEFQAIEESFQQQDARMERLDADQNYYSRKQDQGLLIQDREGGQGYKKSSLQGWAGIGPSYFSTSLSGAGGETSGSTLVLPTFRLGVDWDFSERLRVRGALRSSSGSTDEIGDVNTNGRDFSWLEVQGSVLYFTDYLKKSGGFLAFDGGLQMQTLPYFRLRTQNGNFVANTAYFASDIYFLHLGIHYEVRHKKNWNWEAYGRYLYPVVTSDNFEIESSFPINFELGGGATRPITAGLALGVFGQLHYMAMDTSYSAGGSTINPDLSLMLFTVDARLIANF